VDDSAPALDADLAAAAHESSVAAALLAWLDQKEEGLDMGALVGSASLPEIEAAFAPVERADYLESARLHLLRQLADPQRRYEAWDASVRASFPDTPPSMVEGAVEAWPPPLPPRKLFGSPCMDASIADNREFNRLSLSLGGSMEDVHADKVLQELEKPASVKGNAIFFALCTELRNSRRSATLPSAAVDLPRQLLECIVGTSPASPPPPPQTEQRDWRVCTKCSKWRDVAGAPAIAPTPALAAAPAAAPSAAEDAEMPAPAPTTPAPSAPAPVPAGESGAATAAPVRGPFCCADCSAPEEPYAGGRAAELTTGDRCDAFCHRRRLWLAADVVAHRTDAVQVRFAKRGADTREVVDWLPRRPAKGALPALSALYAYTSKQDEAKEYVTTETVRFEMSAFGPRATMGDYMRLIDKVQGMSRMLKSELARTVAELVNSVSEMGGESLGRREVKVSRKVLVRPGGTLAAAKPATSRDPATSLQSAVSKDHREAHCVFFKEFKRVLGSGAPFDRISAYADALSVQQLECWNPMAWSGRLQRYGGFLDDTMDEEACVATLPERPDREEDECFMLRGMSVATPLGEAVVVDRTAPRTYLLALPARSAGQKVQTPSGEGRVEAFDEQTKLATVRLRDGSVLQLHDPAMLVEMLLAVPPDPWLAARNDRVALEELFVDRRAKMAAAGLSGVASDADAANGDGATADNDADNDPDNDADAANGDGAADADAANRDGNGSGDGDGAAAGGDGDAAGGDEDAAGGDAAGGDEDAAGGDAADGDTADGDESAPAEQEPEADGQGPAK
jgi:hypothetical protein